MRHVVPLSLRAVAAAVLALAAPFASASGVVADVNGSASTPNLFYSSSTDLAGWKWTATQSFSWDGLGSTFQPIPGITPAGVSLVIASDVPTAGNTLRSTTLDAAGHASFAPLAVSAGTTYFIGYSHLTNVGVNIVNFTFTNPPVQPPGTINLSGWYHGTDFSIFTPVMEGGTLQVFSAPILRFEGVLPAVPEPSSLLLLSLGALALVPVVRRRAR